MCRLRNNCDIQVQPNPRRLDALDGKFGVLKLAKSFIT